MDLHTQVNLHITRVCEKIKSSTSVRYLSNYYMQFNYLYPNNNRTKTNDTHITITCN